MTFGSEKICCAFFNMLQHFTEKTTDRLNHIHPMAACMLLNRGLIEKDYEGLFTVCHQHNKGVRDASVWIWFMCLLMCKL